MNDFGFCFTMLNRYQAAQLGRDTMNYRVTIIGNPAYRPARYDAMREASNGGAILRALRAELRDGCAVVLDQDEAKIVLAVQIWQDEERRESPLGLKMTRLERKIARWGVLDEGDYAARRAEWE